MTGASASVQVTSAWPVEGGAVTVTISAAWPEDTQVHVLMAAIEATTEGVLAATTATQRTLGEAS